MKIAITGHTAGIGQALAEAFKSEGHDIIGLSRREGNNIRNTPKICDLIEPCDMFVNNAQAGFAQTELLFEMCRRWSGTNRPIWVIGSQMTLAPVSTIPGMDEYLVQKQALELACTQLRYQGHNVIVVKPGVVATQPGNTGADPETWARVLVSIHRMAQANNLFIPEISLGPPYDA